MPINLNPFARVGLKNRRIRRLEYEVVSLDAQLQILFGLIGQMKGKVKKGKIITKGG